MRNTLNSKRSKERGRSNRKAKNRSRCKRSNQGPSTYSDTSRYGHMRAKLRPLHIPLVVAAALPLVSEGSILNSEKHALGDNHRSETSSTSFFQSIDRDGDGTVARAELSEFLLTSIGGIEFDEGSEVESEIDSVMKNLDKRSDGLEEKDVFDYWKKLEMLLTVNEVAEWVEHAVQLPDVAKIFRENHITGYDFPELVENNGEALLNELKIENKMKRGKILRLVQARMLGIGTSPDKPANMQYEVENCNTVSLLWDKSKASVFPVHSYRVQRKKIGSVGIPLTNHSNSCQRIPKSQMKNSKSSTKNEENNEKLNGILVVSEGALTSDRRSNLAPMDETCSRQKELTADTLQWKTIYIGADNDFVDTDLEPGDGYLYRVQAWSSHGKSNWSREDMTKKWKNMQCTSSHERTAPPRRRYFDGGFWRVIRSLWALGNTCGNILMTLLVVAGSVSRFKRGQLTSTASYLEPVFPWLWIGINWLSKMLTGLEIVPKSLTEDESFRQESSTFHDRVMKLVGLQGYETSPHRPKRSQEVRRINSSQIISDQVDPNDNRLIRRTSSNVDMVETGKKKAVFRRKITSSKSSQSIDLKVEQYGDLSNDAVVTSKTEIPKPKRRKGLFKRKQSVGNNNLKIELEGETSYKGKESDPHPVGIIGSQRTFRSCNSSLSGGEIDCNTQQKRSSYDELEYCNVCFKRYKFPKRCRHHCARCSATFCHKHGRTTHNNLVPCKVPGDCVCNVCLDLEQAVNRK